MVKVVAVSLIAVAVMVWLVASPPQIFANDPMPPTIRAHPGPIKHRPEGYAAGQNRPRATQILIEQNAEPTAPIDINLILPQ